MKPRLADIMREYHKVAHPVGDGTTQQYLWSRFDSVTPGLGEIMMKGYNQMRHPLHRENIPSLVERLDAFIPGLGPLIMEYDQISHREHTSSYANEIPFEHLAERFNEITGKAYSPRQKQLLQKTDDILLRDRLQYFMDCALDLYDGLKGPSDKKLILVIQSVEDIIYSTMYREHLKKMIDSVALSLYRAIEEQKHPVDNIPLVFLELVAVIKDKRGINVPTAGILRQH